METASQGITVPQMEPESNLANFQVFQDNPFYQLLLNYIPNHLTSSSPMDFFPTTIKCNKDQKDIEKDPSSLIALQLGFGTYNFLFEGSKLTAIHNEVGIPVTNFRGHPTTRRDIKIIAEGKDGLNILRCLHGKLYFDSMNKAKKGNFKLYQWDACRCTWSHQKTIEARPLSSVILDPSIKDKLIGDMEEFLGEETKEFYKKHGIPYRRSYLLHGSPGSGKTSVIQAIAGHYERSLCFIQPTNKKITDDSFKTAMSCLPASAIVVLEDIDALFQKDRSKQESNSSSLTFSGLLNGLDGVDSANGQLIFMTTNFREKLDSALIRPGRVDLHVRFPWSTKFQMEEYFRQYYPEADNKLAVSFALKLTSMLRQDQQNVSTSSLQHFFVTNRKHTAEETLSKINEIFEELKTREEEEAAEVEEKELKRKRKEEKENAEKEDTGEEKKESA